MLYSFHLNSLIPYRNQEYVYTRFRLNNYEAGCIFRVPACVGEGAGFIEI